MKIACVCQSGLGTSFMVQMNLQAILKEENVSEPISIDHMDTGSATADVADYFFAEQSLTPALVSIPQEKIVPLSSLIDKEIARAALNKVLDDNGIRHD